MDYRVFSASTGEEDNSTEAHVFARAYRAAWRTAYASEPAGRHQVEGLEIVIDFGGHPVARAGIAHAGKAPRTWTGSDPASAPVNVPTGDHHDN
jgi:hypothetical protein